jgi:integrase/recombinase XerD
MLTHALTDYFHYLQIERGLAENTLMAYRRDLVQYMEFMQAKQIKEWNEVDRHHIIQFLAILREKNRSTATISVRNVFFILHPSIHENF